MAWQNKEGLMKRIIVCADGTMNTPFQTTRGGNQDYKPFSLKAFKTNFWVWILGAIVGYYLVTLQENTLLMKFIVGTVFLLITVLLANEYYLRRLGKNYQGLRKKLLWRYYATQGKRTPSHVVKIMRAVKPTAITTGKHGNKIEVPQIVFYDKGIGTGGLSDAIIGGGLGAGLKENVLDCYNFIAHNYEAGDEIFLFGFSRGAFTVRVLSGLLAECGLLTKRDNHYAPEAYEVFKLQATNKSGREALLKSFRQGKVNNKSYGARNDPCRNVSIKFLGIWDTVPAIGMAGIFGRIGGALGRHFRMNNFTLAKNVVHAYHALALDENRRAFDPLLWDSPPKYMKGAQVIFKEMEQRWFVGVHTTVGGGFDKDELSYFTLKWIVDKADNCGLQMDKTYLNFYMPKQSSYKEEIHRNPWWIYPLEGFWKKRVVKLPGVSFSDYKNKWSMSDKIRYFFDKKAINLRHDSRETIDPSVYDRLKARKDYNKRTYVAEIP